MTNMPQTAEHKRLTDSEARRADWKNWGPYVSDRAWGTVREDYSATGEAWEYFDFWQAHRRAYRWNEDGLGGVCNRLQNICLGVALWNEKTQFSKNDYLGLRAIKAIMVKTSKNIIITLTAPPPTLT